MRFCDFCLLSRGSLATEGPAEISFDYRVANADQEDHVSELYPKFNAFIYSLETSVPLLTKAMGE
jgi:hypothetical protein